MNKKIALNTDQIDNLLKNCTKFKGTFACDQIPNVNDSEYSLIVNTDVSELPGQHWTALMFKGNNVYYFDSFTLILVKVIFVLNFKVFSIFEFDTVPDVNSTATFHAGAG